MKKHYDKYQEYKNRICKSNARQPLTLEKLPKAGSSRSKSKALKIESAGLENLGSDIAAGNPNKWKNL